MSSLETLRQQAAVEETSPVDELGAIRNRALEHVSSTGRGISDYREHLGIELEDLRGKRILDVGAGFSIFAREAKEHGAETISLEPQDPTQRLDMMPEDKAEFRKALSRGEIVPGIVQELPFEDGSFDRVFAVLSVPYYLPRVESERILAFDEMVRVLKPGGEIRIFPTQIGGGKPESVSEEVVTKLESEGCQVQFESSESDNPAICRMIIRKL
ncbi:MAG: class I SAM-dependent methyltransferase [Candidatus Saccharimonadales bacterium]|jgi:ubiquinone/menaquinone biosynthesis C-methylase UbiE